MRPEASQRWTRSEENTLERMVAIGATQAQIAAKLGRSVDSVCQKKARLARGVARRAGRQWTRSEEVELERMVAGGASNPQIAAALGRSWQSVYSKRHKRYGGRQISTAQARRIVVAYCKLAELSSRPTHSEETEGAIGALFDRANEAVRHMRIAPEEAENDPLMSAARDYRNTLNRVDPNAVKGVSHFEMSPGNMRALTKAHDNLMTAWANDGGTNRNTEAAYA